MTDTRLTDGYFPVQFSPRSTKNTAVQPRHAPHLALALAFTLLPKPARLIAQEAETTGFYSENSTVTEPETRISGSISDGTPSPSAPKPASIKFDVLSSKTRRVHVVEAPEMPGLPAPQGDIKLTVQLVKNPGLPEPPPPLPPLPPTDPAVQARFAELAKSYRETQLAFVSATVYDHKRTYFRCYPSGGAKREICGWSNLDFNHFTGFANFQVKGTDGEIRRYGLMMGIGNEDTKQRAEFLASHDREYNQPEIPPLADMASGGPAFKITEGDTTDKEAMELVQGMHSLYQVEGKRMEEAYHARLKTYEERKAYLLAHPPKPKDVTIRCWKRVVSSKKAATAQPGTSDESK
jgi:hypothetical protein